jgi:NADH-quinone oxidoreductase subunit L
MFHLMTHAFFKALLFLAAGLVIHSLTGEQDIRKMGGLGKLMPHTRNVFLVGSLALVGIPPFAGFFSKDSIIAATLERGGAFGYILFAACLAGAFLTGLYTFRLFFIVFAGAPSAFVKEHFHAHPGKSEGPISMVWTVTVLAALSAIGGFLQFGRWWHPLSDWLAPAIVSLNPHAFPPATALVDAIPEATNREEIIASVCAVALGLAGMAVAWAMYSAKSLRVPKALPILEHKFYWDELYNAIFYRPADFIARSLGRFVEQPLIAGSIRGVTSGFGFGSHELGRVQNGLVRTYALALVSGVSILIVVFLAAK